MANDIQPTDSALIAQLGERIARQRLTRNMTQEALAREAGVSKRTVVRLEAGASTQLTNLIRILRALDLLPALDALIPPPLVSPLERLRSQRDERSRATGRRGGTRGGTGEGARQASRDGAGGGARSAASKPAAPWTWGDEAPGAEGTARKRS